VNHSKKLEGERPASRFCKVESKENQRTPRSLQLIRKHWRASGPRAVSVNWNRKKPCGFAIAWQTLAIVCQTVATLWQTLAISSRRLLNAHLLVPAGLGLVLVLGSGCASTLSRPIDAGVEVVPAVSTLTSLKSHGDSIESLRESRSDSVVLLYSLHGGQAGSAIIVNTNGLFYTAGHVLEQTGSDFIAYLPDRRITNARALFVDKTHDFGVGILDSGPWPAVPIRSTLPQPGEWVATLGYPEGFGNGQTPSVRAGRVRYLAGPDRRPWFLITDCPTWKGDSGGPIFDLDGNLIGITSWASLSPAANASIPVASMRIPATDLNARTKRGSGLLFLSRMSRTAVPDHLRLSRIPLLGHSFGWNRRPERKFTRQRTDAVPTITAHQAVVECLQGRKRLCLGTVVSADGLIMAKESETRDRITHVRLADGRVLPTELLARNFPTDLALFSVEADGLPHLGEDDAADAPSAGHFLVSPLPDGESCLGLLAKPALVREGADKVEPPRLVVKVTPVSGGLQIDAVTPEAARSTLGLEIGDVVVQVGEVTDLDQKSLREALRRVINRRQPVKATLFRDGRRMETKLGLFKKPPPRAVRNVTRGFVDWMAGPISIRHKNLDGTFRHDSVLSPNECGGPLFDLDGNWIGLNVSRAGRDRTLAWDAETVLETLEFLKVAGR